MTHTLGIKKIEETSYNEQMNLLIIYYMIIVQLMLFYVNNIDQINLIGKNQKKHNYILNFIIMIKFL